MSSPLYHYNPKFVSAMNPTVVFSSSWFIYNLCHLSLASISSKEHLFTSYASCREKWSFTWLSLYLWHCLTQCHGELVLLIIISSTNHCSPTKSSWSPCSTFNLSTTRAHSSSVLVRGHCPHPWLSRQSTPESVLMNSPVYAIDYLVSRATSSSRIAWH